MKGVSENQLGILLSSMSDQSAGMLLGWGAAKVARHRVNLAAAPAPPAALQLVAEPVVQEMPQDAPAAPAPPPAATPAPPAPPLPVLATSDGVVVVVSVTATLAPKPSPVYLVPPRKLEFCRRFLASGWSMREVANLFDLHPDELKAAL